MRISWPRSPSASSSAARWVDRSPCIPTCSELTLEVILKAVFGVSDAERLARLRRLVPRLLDATSMSMQVRMLARRMRDAVPPPALRALTNDIDAELFAEIAERRRDRAVPDRADVLSLLIVARFEDGSAMDDRELRDQLMTLLVAGHETTATALAWTFVPPLRNPAALARLITEVDEDDGDEYLRAVISESLRIVWLCCLRVEGSPRSFARMGSGSPRARCHPGGMVDPHPNRPVSRATCVSTRTLPRRTAVTYGWIPFGGGVRRCLGAAFAEIEMRSCSAACCELAP